MNNSSDKWKQWILETPNSIKAIIGLITLIVGFITLFQANQRLALVVTIGVVSFGILIISLYILFSKKASTLFGGGRIYQYPKYRPWAILSLIISSALLIFGIGNSDSREFIWAAILGRPLPEENPIGTFGLINNGILLSRVIEDTNLGFPDATKLSVWLASEGDDTLSKECFFGVSAVLYWECLFQW